MKVMKEQRLKYYSKLSSKQKDNIFKNALTMKENQILEKIELSKLIEFRNHFDKLIKGQKCFKHKGNYYPFNIKKIIA